MKVEKHRLGFSLIELMITLAIIAIVAAVAYPSYRGQILKSQRAEGRGLLLETAQALEKCRALYGAYNNANCAVGDKVTGGNSIESTEGYYEVSASSLAAATFALQAVPEHSDPECGTLTLDETGTRGEGGTATDPNDCW